MDGCLRINLNYRMILDEVTAMRFDPQFLRQLHAKSHITDSEFPLAMTCES